MDTIVSTRTGQVRGRASDGVSAFLGISYAAPPVGAGRLRPPRPVEPWAGVRDATALGPEPPQPQFDPRRPLGPALRSRRPRGRLPEPQHLDARPRARPDCR